ncbi:MAG: hypothetical protein ACE5GA_03285, partial [Candidatus Zixiibacteriota bacterium]
MRTERTIMNGHSLARRGYRAPETRLRMITLSAPLALALIVFGVPVRTGAEQAPAKNHTPALIMEAETHLSNAVQLTF